MRQFDARINLGERLGLGAAQLGSIAAVVAHGSVLEELRGVEVSVQDADIGHARCVVPLNLHLRVGVVGHGSGVEVAAEGFPFALRTAARLLVDEPAVEAVVLCHLIKLHGHRVVAAFGLQHLANPNLCAAEGSGREEDVAERLHAALVGSIRRAGWRDVDDALAGCAGPIDQLVHVLPIRGLIAEEVAQLALRRAERTRGVQDGGVANLSLVVLVLVGLHEGRLFESGLQRYLGHVEGIVGIGAGRPVLDVLRVATNVERLLSEAHCSRQQQCCREG